MTAPREMLRRQLEQADPDLHRALMRNWETAWAEWLPALGSKSDSYNSYPHIRNVEHHLDNLLMVEEGSPASSRRVQFRPVEIYVLLASALFHDIGRTKTKEDAKHAWESQQLLLKHHASFGIPSRGLAEIIGHVCRAHDSQQGPNDSELTTRVVEPYGEVRVRSLATLLFLADHMDSAFRRVLPEYIRPEGEIEVVGAFRRVIRGVEVDHRSRVIRTVLGDFEEEGKEPAELEYCAKKEGEAAPKEAERGQGKAQGNDLRVQEARADEKAGQVGEQSTGDEKACHEAKRELNLKPACTTGELLKALDEADSRQNVPLARPQSIVDLARGVRLVETMLKKASGEGPFDPIDWLIARRRIQVKRKKEQGTAEANAAGESQAKATTWPRLKILAVIVGDVLANAIALARVRDNLAAMGLPLRAWVLEGHERLFNHWGEETYEPVFSRDYLLRLATSMWDLSTRVFGRSLFTYENLADAICEPDVGRVRTAVHRIARVMWDVTQEGCDWQGALWAGDTHWRWNAGSLPKQQTTRLSRWCWSIHLSKVLDAIRWLGEPT